MRLNSVSGKAMAIIRVPKTPKTAYDPQRPAGTLLQSQITHLEWATRPAAERGPERFDVVPAATEAEAAERIAALTRKLHGQTLGREPMIAPATTTKKPNTSRRRATRPQTSKRKKTRRRSR